VEIKLTLALPRDAMSVPVVRRVLNRSMETIGVDRVCRTDIEVALTEAVTNVLDHAVDGDDYEVTAMIDDRHCAIEVIDRGRGFDAERLGHADADPSAEEGRGIQLIRALVDRVRFTNRPEQGAIVHLEKDLTYDEDAPVKLLSGSPAYPMGEAIDEVREERENFESAATVET
jgi:serine/threonine-protein kinase RsbW